MHPTGLLRPSLYIANEKGCRRGPGACEPLGKSSSLPSSLLGRVSSVIQVDPDYSDMCPSKKGEAEEDVTD